MSKYATKEQLISIVQDMASKISVPTIGIGGGYAPIGTVISYMGVTAPQDYLACDGSTYNISAYPDLADLFQSQFGSANFFGGDGTTTFAVPDLRGEFLRGTGTNSHTNQGNGATVGTHQDATEVLPIGYDKDFKALYTSAAPTDTNSSCKKADTYIRTSSPDTKGYRYGSNSNWDSTDTAIRITTRPTNTSILWCIKAVATGAGIVFDETGAERIVGEYKYANGTKKPVYEKEIYGSLPTNIVAEQQTDIDIAHNVSDLDFPISYDGYIYSVHPTTGNRGVYKMLGYMWPIDWHSVDVDMAYPVLYSLQFKSNTSTLLLRLCCRPESLDSLNNNSKYRILFRYTKTTD